LCDEFEANLKAGSRPNPQEYLEQVSEQDRSTLLFELNALIEAYQPQIERTSNPQVADNLDTTLPANTKEYEKVALPAQVGKYKILGKLGEGAMGIVYRAHHPVLKQDIALKTIRPQNVQKWGETQRILMEARSVAKLKHSHVIAIHDADEADGQPYFTMALVEGGTLQSHLDEYRYGTSQKTECENQFNLTSTGWSRKQIAARKNKILTLMGKVCRAVHAAHAHVPTIIHRDVKPGNILLDGDEPRVSDFGLAKSISPDDEEHFSEAGTPPYMSPEQYRGESKNILATSDIWALGVVLYELFTGRRPFWGATHRDIKEAVLNTEPQRPKEWNKLIDLDLEAVILKCLQKDAARRYQSAADLADDLARCREGIPIPIRPIRHSERLRRWACRKPAQAVLCGMIILTAAAAIALYIRDLNQKSNFVRMEQIRSANDALEKGTRLCSDGETSEGLLWLARSYEMAPVDATDLREQVQAKISYYFEKTPQLHEIIDEGKRVLAIAFNPNGDCFITGNADGVARLYDTKKRKLIRTLRHDNNTSVLAVAFNHDGTSVLTGGFDGYARLWSLESKGDSPQQSVHHGAIVFAVGFSIDGNFLLSGGHDGAVQLWDAKSGKPSGSLQQQLKGYQVYSLAVNPDGKRIMIGSGTVNGGLGEAQLWDLTTQRQIGSPLAHNTGTVWAIAFCPDRNSVLTATNGQSQKWDLNTKDGPIRMMAEKDKSVRSVTASSDGRFILMGGNDRMARIWDLVSNKHYCPPMHHPHVVRSVAFVPNEKDLIVTCCEDGAIRFWKMPDKFHGKMDRIVLSTQVLNGMEIDPSGHARTLESREWHTRQQQLMERDGKPVP
jgi:serine/threonine protein kinase